jgi:hypothetical protein
MLLAFTDAIVSSKKRLKEISGFRDCFVRNRQGDVMNSSYYFVDATELIYSISTV